MDEIVYNHGLNEAKDISLAGGDDFAYVQALCISPIWEEADIEQRFRAPSRQSSNQHSLKWLLSILSQSPSLSVLMEEIDIDQWGFLVSKDGLDTYKIDIEKEVVLLPSLMKKAKSSNNLILNMIRALRDIWYEDNHFDLYETLRPEELLKWERIRSADIESFTVMVAWELRIAGESSLWRTLMGSDIGDMAIIFQAIHEQNIELESYNESLMHTFRQWYMVEERISDTDSVTLSAIDDAIFDYNTKTSFGDNRLCANDVEDRLEYLSNVAQMLNNPDFCEIPDEINQTHFFHIMNDLESVEVSGVRFRDKALAAKIFPVQ